MTDGIYFSFDYWRLIYPIHRYGNSLNFQPMLQRSPGVVKTGKGILECLSEAEASVLITDISSEN